MDSCYSLNITTGLNKNSADVWHSRFCHVGFDTIARMSRSELIPKCDIVKNSKCQTCVQAKQPRKPFKALESEKNLAPLDLIHSDLCEMNGVLTKGGKKYFLTFIDDATRYCYVYLLKSKDEALNYFRIYKAEVENQLEKKIKRLRDDRGGEYISNDFSNFCSEHGIIHEFTPPYSPQSNGVAERKNQSLTDLVNALLESAGMPKMWWGEAILTVNFVLNRVITKRSDITPYEAWRGRKPNVNFLRTWGCLVKVNIPKPKKRKLGPKTVDCIFIGYAQNSPAYRFLVVKSDTPEIIVDTIMESKDVTFFEDIFPMRPSSSTLENLDATIPNSEQVENIPLRENNEEDNNSDITPRRSKRQKVQKSFGDDFIVYLVDDVPTTLADAYASSDANYWKEAVRSEMDSIMINETWEITERPVGCKPIGCKWIFKKKMRPDGTIEKYKARLVAKGFTQK